jgi:hypothetical protein
MEVCRCKCSFLRNLASKSVLEALKAALYARPFLCNDNQIRGGRCHWQWYGPPGPKPNIGLDCGVWHENKNKNKKGETP